MPINAGVGELSPAPDSFKDGDVGAGLERPLNSFVERLQGMVRLPDRERVRAEARLIWRHFRAGFAADNCAFAAGALTYTSLLSLVPLMAVTFSVLAAFPVFESVTADLQSKPAGQVSEQALVQM